MMRESFSLGLNSGYDVHFFLILLYCIKLHFCGRPNTVESLIIARYFTKQIPKIELVTDNFILEKTTLILFQCRSWIRIRQV